MTFDVGDTKFQTNDTTVLYWLDDVPSLIVTIDSDKN